MKERIKHCTVCYSGTELRGERAEVSKGIAADFAVNTLEKDADGCDYFIDHYPEPDFLLRGFVTDIKAVFVDKKGDETTNNGRVYLDANHIDGYNDDANYQGRDSVDVDYYIIELDDVVITKRPFYKFSEDLDFWVEIETYYDVNTIFYCYEAIGDVNGLTIPSYGYVKLPDMPWRKELAIWQKDFDNHIKYGYEKWNNEDWLAWWLRGWRLAKFIKEFLPKGIRVEYGERSQCRKVITPNHYDCGWETNSDGFRVTIVTDMTDKIERGIYIDKTIIDNTYKACKQTRSKFIVQQTNHHFFPTDRVVLCTDDKKSYYLATINSVTDDGIIVDCDKPIDLGQVYSIELII